MATPTVQDAANVSENWNIQNDNVFCNSCDHFDCNVFLMNKSKLGYEITAIGKIQSLQKLQG